MTGIDGYVAPGYEGVREAFAGNFAERGEVGAAFAAVVDGEPVVDLWGGVADSRDGAPWREETLALFFSGTKGLVAVCVLMLVERGALDLDAPVAEYWPEFAARGKGHVRVRDVLAHRARLPAVRTPLAAAELTDDVRMAALLAAQPQEADPRAAFAYHALTYGWLCGELVRRADGRSVGRFFADEVAAPLRLEAWIGLPAAVEARVAQLELAPNWGESAAMDPAQADDAMLQAIWGNPPLFEDELPWNTRAFRAAELPGANGIGAARSIARLYGCLARGGELDGVRLLSEATLALGRQEASRGYEPFVEKDMAFGVGFALQTPAAELGPPPDAFGHGGAGGSMHGAWPRERAGFSYVMNRLRDDEDTDPRADALLAALHAAVGAADARGQAPSAA